MAAVESKVTNLRLKLGLDHPPGYRFKWFGNTVTPRFGEQRNTTSGIGGLIKLTMVDHTYIRIYTTLGSSENHPLKSAVHTGGDM